MEGGRERSLEIDKENKKTEGWMGRVDRWCEIRERQN